MFIYIVWLKGAFTEKDGFLLFRGPAKWRVTVSGDLRFMTSYLESYNYLIVTSLNYPNYIENQI